MRSYYLMDLTHNYRSKRRDQIYLVAAKIAVKYGTFGTSLKKIHQSFSENRIREFWNYDDNIPSPEIFRRDIRVKTVKWYIHNHIQSDGEIWNSDFIHGLAKNGKLLYSSKSFPVFRWNGSRTILEVLKHTPFGGTLCDGGENQLVSSWSYVPAFYIKHSEDSLSFMSGVLSSGIIVKRGGITLVKYYKRILDTLKKWGIPVESTIEHLGIIFISPIWPALFSLKMPQEIRNKWFDLKNAANTDIYAPILWKTYISNDFVVDGIPYLSSRRKIYYDYKCDEGAMRKLEMLRLKMGLLNLDRKVGEMVKLWKTRTEKQDEVSVN